MKNEWFCFNRCRWKRHFIKSSYSISVHSTNWYLGCLWELSIRFMKWRTRMNVSAFYFLFYSSKLFATQGWWCISLDGYLVSKSQYLTIKVCTMPTADWLTGNGSRQFFFAHRLYIKDCPSSGSEKGRRCRNVLNLQPGC